MGQFERQQRFVDEVNERELVLPDDISAHELLRLVYRGKVKLTPQRLRAAEAALPYESPKLSAVGFVRDMDTFAVRLDRALERSAKVINAKALPPPIDDERAQAEND
jgi:hypothetical protein